MVLLIVVIVIVYLIGVYKTAETLYIVEQLEDELKREIAEFKKEVDDGK